VIVHRAAIHDKSPTSSRILLARRCQRTACGQCGQKDEDASGSDSGQTCVRSASPGQAGLREVVSTFEYLDCTESTDVRHTFDTRRMSVNCPQRSVRWK